MYNKGKKLETLADLLELGNILPLIKQLHCDKEQLEKDDYPKAKTADELRIIETFLPTVRLLQVWSHPIDIDALTPETAMIAWDILNKAWSKEKLTWVCTPLAKDIKIMKEKYSHLIEDELSDCDL